MGKRPLKAALLVLVLVLVLLCGTAFALMFRRTSEMRNQFEAARVSCDVTEKFDGTIKSSIAVRNTGNIDAYLRLRLVSYWVDSNGNIVSKPTQLPTISPANGWLSGPDNTYYYPQPVAPGDTTLNLLSTGLTLVEEDGYLQVVEVFADAIQSKPAEAVTGSWGVTLVGDKITNAP